MRNSEARGSSGGSCRFPTELRSGGVRVITTTANRPITLAKPSSRDAVIDTEGKEKILYGAKSQEKGAPGDSNPVRGGCMCNDESGRGIPRPLSLIQTLLGER